MKTITGGVTAPIGFRAAGMYCGIKKKQKKQLDLALLVSEQEGPVAGVFTTNQVVAAPVVLDRLHQKRCGPRYPRQQRERQCLHRT